MLCVTCPCWRRGDLRISWNVSAHPLKGLQLFLRRSSILSFILSMPESDLGSWVLATPAWGSCFGPVTSSDLDTSYNPCWEPSTSCRESRKYIWDLAIENLDLEIGEVSTGDWDSLPLLAGFSESLQPESSYLPLFFKGGYSISVFLLFCTQVWGIPFSLTMRNSFFFFLF